MNSDKIITIYNFEYLGEAAIVRARLESEGIPCMIQNELISQIAPFYSDTFGGVKLQVNESDVPQAMEILKEAGYIEEGE